MPHEFLIADVFTERAFGGNQLAVFPDATGISDAAMQSLAREFNFSETTFVLPPRSAGALAQVRIFNPQTEMPFAGHPTVGTAAVLASLGRIAVRDGRATIVFDEGVGPVRVDVTVTNGATHARLTVERGAESPGHVPALADAAAVLSLPASAVRDTWFASAGFPFCFIHLDSTTTVDRARLDANVWSAKFANAWSSKLFMFAGDPAPGGPLYARMFAPGIGIGEDAATGSACATLAGVLGARAPQPDGIVQWRVEQGVALGRPSVLEASAEKRGGRVTSVSVGGYSVIVGRGTVTVT